MKAQRWIISLPLFIAAWSYPAHAGTATSVTEIIQAAEKIKMESTAAKLATEAEKAAELKRLGMTAEEVSKLRKADLLDGIPELKYQDFDMSAVVDLGFSDNGPMGMDEQLQMEVQNAFGKFWNEQTYKDKIFRTPQNMNDAAVAGKEAYSFVMTLLKKGGKMDEDAVATLADLLHQRWVARNSKFARPDQMVAFSKLSDAEKKKYTDPIIDALKRLRKDQERTVGSLINKEKQYLQSKNLTSSENLKILENKLSLIQSRGSLESISVAGKPANSTH